MDSRSGVGFSEQADSFSAGAAATRDALLQAGVDEVDLVFMTATGAHDPGPFRDGVRSVVGTRPRLVGGSAAGVFTNDRLGYEGRQTGVAVLAAPQTRICLFLASRLVGVESDAGAALGQQIEESALSDESSLLLLYPMLSRTAAEGGPAMNMATPLVQGLRQTLGTLPPLAGMGLLADGRFLRPPWLWADDRIETDAALALTLSGDLRMDTLVLHGCRPSGAYHTITRTDANVVLEIEGRPALDVIGELVGPDSGLGWEDWPLFITLGVNRGERFGPYREEHYANRLCLGIDADRRGLVMFEPDLQAGDEVQLMRRSTDLAYVGGAVRGLRDRIEGRRPVLALYIDCLGRAAAFCGAEEEEAEEVQRHLQDIPLLGFYTGVEIASVADHVQALDWTGVLCLFSVPEPG